VAHDSVVAVPPGVSGSLGHKNCGVAGNKKGTRKRAFREDFKTVRWRYLKLPTASASELYTSKTVSSLVICKTS
jgi:hypothetical protein